MEFKRLRLSGFKSFVEPTELVIGGGLTGVVGPNGCGKSNLLEALRWVMGESSYKNMRGTGMRARDVQLLFADASTGARSPALVRQGQIGELIAAKPQSRRKILEEAAGITGLYTRRHEAELRLRAAETNLTRLDDVVGQIETQLSGLKRQARQASRYRSISGDIRKAEAIQLHLRWTDAAE